MRTSAIWFRQLAILLWSNLPLPRYPRKGHVYFVGTSAGEWLGRHLFKANLNDGPSQKVVQLTKEPGMHGVVVDKYLSNQPIFWVEKGVAAAGA